MSDDQDTPIRQMLKVISVLDVTPGYADVAETGEPIGIVTTAFRKEVEQPMMLSLKDVKKLAVGLMKVLAHHGDDHAGRLIEQYNTAAPQPTFTVQAEHWNPPVKRVAPPKPPSMCSGLPLTELALSVGFQDTTVPPLTLHVLGGYSVGKRMMVLFRCTAFGDPVDGIACVEGNRRLRFKEVTDAAYLPQAKWKEFVSFSHNHVFWVADRRCQKLSVRSLRQRLSGGPFLSI